MKKVSEEPTAPPAAKEVAPTRHFAPRDSYRQTQSCFQDLLPIRELHQVAVRFPSSPVLRVAGPPTSALLLQHWGRQDSSPGLPLQRVRPCPAATLARLSAGPPLMTFKPLPPQTA